MNTQIHHRRNWVFVPPWLALTCTLTACADDWPQWRGPGRDGISRETGLLKEWPAAGPKLLWQAKEIGGGYSTPAIVRDRIYVLGNEGMDNEFVQALAVADGKKIWSATLGKVGPNEGPQYPAARSTPTVDGDVLYALGSDGNLASVETAGGKVRWSKNLRTDFGGKPGKWAYSESPLVDGDALVCTPGGGEATMVALNKKTGEVIWKAAVPGGDPAAYASVIIADIGGVKQYVQFLEKGLVGVDAKTGKFLWRYEQTAKGSPANIPTPVADKDYIYSGTGRAGGGLVKIKASGEAFEAEQITFTPKLPTSIGGAVKIGEHLYGTTAQALLCAEFRTGSLKWEDRAIGAASLLHADGRLYLHGENGQVALVEPSPEGYREKGRFTPPEGPDRGRSKAWAYPALANGRLYIRDLTSLWCYDIKAAGATAFLHDAVK
jgi:outer membrane protein assembly factor BamB